MKQLLLFWLASALALQAQAQLPTNSYAVSTPCPSSLNQPSELSKINTDGSITPIGVVNEAGTGIVVNGLGYNDNNRVALYAMRVVAPTVESIQEGTPPDLFRIDLTTAVATNVGPMTPPPTPTTGLTPASGAGRTARDYRQTLNFVGDSNPSGTYYLGGVTFRISALFFGDLPFPGTATVTDVRLYVGTTSLPVVPAPVAAPTWRQLDASDPATAAIIETYRAQIQAYINSGLSTPVPEGGIQDWVYDKPSGNLVSYIGQSGQYLTITNPATAPVAVTTTPTVPLPPLPPGTTDNNIGSMFSDQFSNVYVVRAGSGEIFRVDNVTGNYENRSFGSALGCNRGDAVSFPDALPLPVTLTRFDATATGPTVRLTWATTFEERASHFEVERSATATAWNTVARVAAGNQATGQQYAATDARPLPGTAYYRLAMHDRDGTVSYSSVRTVRSAATTAVYPNPVRNAAQVLLPMPGQSATLELVSARGAVVRRLTAPAGVASVEVPMADLPAGFYLLRVQQAGATSTTRLILEK
ncbi:T9SS type A sorting domain-containing protein [Hymenobacter terrestris]|uniref:T9SS type A sorting domain-containing protein n=1 Tax=Hymenobacter terrestris TaxID=2748310 RepID=A0ABX2Q5A5_9BACT|nr:T9SS type A sorting domain-containing protein [Hymenobacter terrestris]NVO86155.1 T9SS type A sorting domain-containing protein [Hymenobacter terrestris]